MTIEPDLDMPYEEIRFKHRRVYPQVATLDPQFGSGSVLAAEPWAFARMRLIQSGMKEAQFYWEQAHEFFESSKNLSTIASALTSYYSVLNATKALLLARSVPHGSKHGVYTSRDPDEHGLAAEQSRVCPRGVLPALITLLAGRQPDEETFSLKELLRLVPYVHRAFLLTYTGAKDMFLTLELPCVVRKVGSTEAWFKAHLSPSHAPPGWELDLPADFEHETGAPPGSVVVRSKHRFRWDDSDSAIEQSLTQLQNNHRRLRAWVVPVISPSNRWYLRRPGATGEHLPLLAVVFMALHRVSELTRYEPTILRRHLDEQEAWLLTEFLQLAPAQYITSVASELTGMQFIRPDAIRI